MTFILGFLTGVVYGAGLAWFYSQYRLAIRNHDRKKDLATGTPIASELAREMGLEFKWNK